MTDDIEDDDTGKYPPRREDPDVPELPEDPDELPPIPVIPGVKTP